MQKMKRITLLLMLLLFVLTLSAQGFDDRPPKGDRKPPEFKGEKISDEGRQEFQGYLVDRSWGERGTDDNGRSILKKPSSITRKHLITMESRKAGYGILIQLPNHKYIFARFDTSGSLRAEDFLDNCKKKNNIMVKVTGFMSRDNVLSVTDIHSVARSAKDTEGRHRGPDGHGDPGKGPGNMPGGGRPEDGFGSSPGF